MNKIETMHRIWCQKNAWPKIRKYDVSSDPDDVDRVNFALKVVNLLNIHFSQVTEIMIAHHHIQSNLHLVNTQLALAKEISVRPCFG